MDFNGDGTRDLISGSYSPGDLFFFERKSNGTFAAAKKILDRNGKAVNVGSASAVFAADWDNDNDLDLVIGNISGEVYFVPNEGSAKTSQFGKPQKLSADGKPIRVNHGDAGPVVADWNGNGLLDLLVGAGDGSVIFYRNKGTKTKPALAGGVELIPAHKKSDTVTCGTRTKICVTDYNQDGRPDLLVGDFTSARKTVNLSPEQKADAEKAKKEYQEVLKEYQAAYQKSGLTELSRKYREVYRPQKGETPDQAREREAKRKKIMAQMNELRQKEPLQALLKKLSSVSRRMSPGLSMEYHGHVWLYLRKPVEEKAAAKE